MDPSSFPVFDPARASRRAFLGFATAVVAAIGCAACGHEQAAVGTGGAGTSGSNTTSGATDNDPVWLSVPTISFVQGVASSISVAAFVSDPDGDVLTLLLNGVDLPAGVTFDAAGQRFVYDGIGAVGGTDGHVLTADDGKGA